MAAVPCRTAFPLQLLVSPATRTKARASLAPLRVCVGPAWHRLGSVWASLAPPVRVCLVRKAVPQPLPISPDGPVFAEGRATSAQWRKQGLTENSVPEEAGSVEGREKINKIIIIIIKTHTHTHGEGAPPSTFLMHWLMALRCSLVGSASALRTPPPRPPVSGSPPRLAAPGVPMARRHTRARKPVHPLHSLGAPYLGVPAPEASRGQGAREEGPRREGPHRAHPRALGARL